MLSDHLRRYARACWEVVRPDLGEAGQVAQRELDRLTGDPRILMELTLGTLPASDVASVPFEVLLAYVRHALSLREHSPIAGMCPKIFFSTMCFTPASIRRIWWTAGASLPKWWPRRWRDCRDWKRPWLSIGGAPGK